MSGPRPEDRASRPREAPRADGASSGMTLAEVHALRAEIGVLDATQARQWHPPPGVSGRVIRGATGSPWINRLSTAVFLAIVGLTLGAVALFAILGQKLLVLGRGPDPVVCAAVVGRALERPDVLAQLPAVASGQMRLTPTLGTTAVDSLQERRVQTVPYQGGRVRIERDLTHADTLLAVEVSHPSWQSPCEGLLAARWLVAGDTLRLGRDGSVERNGKAVTSPTPGWELRTFDKDATHGVLIRMVRSGRGE